MSRGDIGTRPGKLAETGASSRLGPASKQKGNGKGRKQWISRIAPRGRRTPSATSHDFSLGPASGRSSQPVVPIESTPCEWTRPVLGAIRLISGFRPFRFPLFGALRGFVASPMEYSTVHCRRRAAQGVLVRHGAALGSRVLATRLGFPNVSARPNERVRLVPPIVATGHGFPPSVRRSARDLRSRPLTHVRYRSRSLAATTRIGGETSGRVLAPPLVGVAL